MSGALKVNDNLILIVGKSATGKSAALREIENPEGVAYLNCEAGKKLPFKSKFKEIIITDPLQVFDAFDEVENIPEIHTIVVDTLTFLMDMYESIMVLPSTNTMAAWGQYQQFFKTLMQDKVANSSKNVIFLAHTAETYNESELVSEVKVPVKGALKNNGIESYFSQVIAAKKISLKQLKDEHKNDMLVITPDEEALGYKHVFQTKLTKETVNERLRGPMGMWGKNETYIDNNVQHVLNRLSEYYS